MKKKVIILKTNDGELANQLWNYVSVYAYCLERGYDISNPSFYEYGSYFSLPKEGWFFDTFFFKPLSGNTKRKWSGKKRFWRELYRLVSNLILILRAGRVIFIKNHDFTNGVLQRFYLPPTPTNEMATTSVNTILNARLQKLENTSGDIILRGWLFRNPVGIEKYRREIQHYFTPTHTIQENVASFITPLKKEFAHLVGVHLRQGDYKTWRGGQYFINESRMKTILEEYLREANLIPAETCFLIASDQAIDTTAFTGLNIKITGKNMVEDLFILASTRAIIGSDSTFGDFAAYYGNIPHIIATKAPIDWPYYRNKISFFPNKYCNWVQY